MRLFCMKSKAVFLRLPLTGLITETAWTRKPCLHSGMAVSYMLPRIVGLPLANELLFTGRLITGEETAGIGLANYVLEGDQVLEKAWELAEEIAGCAPVAVRMIKQAIRRGIQWDPRSASEMDALYQSRTFEMDDAKEGIRALLENRNPVFKGR